jgi:hypothetical protein
LQSLIEEPISDDVTATLLKAIEEKRWWQGSVIHADHIPSNQKEHMGIDYWIIASQACNIYNPCFIKVPVFELMAARLIQQCNPQMSKGDNPRILHVEACSESENTIMAFEIDIQKRKWLPRKLLAELQTPIFHVRDAKCGIARDWSKNLWLDNFSGWLSRSYTRIALPDAFNNAMVRSRIEEILKEKFIKHKEALYGIYLEIGSNTDEGWNGILGEMPPPYLLEIILVTHENFDPELLKVELIDHLFKNKIKDPANKEDITRADLAQKYGIRIVDSAIEARTIAEITLLELKSLVRYTFVDHLSNSSMSFSH